MSGYISINSGIHHQFRIQYKIPRIMLDYQRFQQQRIGKQFLPCRVLRWIPSINGYFLGKNLTFLGACEGWRFIYACASAAFRFIAGATTTHRGALTRLLVYIQGLLKRKKMLQHCLYNDVSWPVTLTHQETLMERIFTSKEYIKLE